MFTTDHVHDKVVNTNKANDEKRFPPSLTHPYNFKSSKQRIIHSSNKQTRKRKEAINNSFF